MEKRRYFVECETCGGDAFTMSQKLTKEANQTWRDIETSKYLCHDGFGWELENFVLTCADCGGTETHVNWEEISWEDESAEEKRLEELVRVSLLEGSLCGSVMGRLALDEAARTRVSRQIAVRAAPIALAYATDLLTVPSVLLKIVHPIKLGMARHRLAVATKDINTRENFEYQRLRVLQEENDVFSLESLFFPWL